MFTGIVGMLGAVAAVDETQTGARLVLSAPGIGEDLAPGDSLAVNGVCLTAVDVERDVVAVDVVQESLSRSNLGNLVKGDVVDLERPMAAHGRFDGHIVQGHVDGVGVIYSITQEGSARRVRVRIPNDLERYVVEKGSVTLDGVSLTVTATGPGEPWLEVVLIPHTLDVTVFGRRAVGDVVNVEVDVLAKYVERMLEARS